MCVPTLMPFPTRRDASHVSGWARFDPMGPELGGSLAGSRPPARIGIARAAVPDPNCDRWSKPVRRVLLRTNARQTAKC